jgi:hypothetical protein
MTQAAASTVVQKQAIRPPRRFRGLVTAASLLAGGCASSPAATTDPVAANGPLAGTRWQLVSFQSADDTVGTLKPPTPARYTMEIMAGGRLGLQVNCNHASGRWAASPQGASGGSLLLNAPLTTRAACPLGAMDTRVAKDLRLVRRYRLDGDVLNLTLRRDRGVYTWRRLPH